MNHKPRQFCECEPCRKATDERIQEWANEKKPTRNEYLMSPAPEHLRPINTAIPEPALYLFPTHRAARKFANRIKPRPSIIPFALLVLAGLALAFFFYLAAVTFWNGGGQ